MYTVTKLGESSVNISRSRFLGYCKPVANQEEAENYIKQLKREHPQAKHIVYVYKIEPNNIKKYNSSEPSGTGAPPIFNLIEKHNLTNIFVAVVRYFGGVLLGTGGLVRAYSDTAMQAIENAVPRELTKYYKLEVEVPFSDVSILEKMDIVVLDRIYGSTVKYIVASKKKQLPFDEVNYLEDVWL